MTSTNMRQVIQSRWLPLLVSIFFLFQLVYCAAPRVTVRVLRPPEIPLEVKQIAVADFRGPGRSGTRAAALLTTKLFETGRFRIVERERLEGIVEEQALALSGIVDERSAAEVGKILGVDALIYGEVTRYQSGEPIEGEKFKRVVQVGNRKWEEEVTEPGSRVRTASVGITFRIVDVRTGQLEAARTASASIRPVAGLSGERKALYIITGVAIFVAAIAVLAHIFSQEDEDKKEDEEGPPWVPSPVPPEAIPPQAPLLPEEEILGNLMEEAIGAFVTQITPHYEEVVRTLQEDGDLVNLGVEYAHSGLWEKAKQVWLEASRLDPENHAAHYDLGVAYEVLGEIELAAAAYRQALSIKPQRMYMEALADVEGLIEKPEGR